MFGSILKIVENVTGIAATAQTRAVKREERQRKKAHRENVKALKKQLQQLSNQINLDILDGKDIAAKVVERDELTRQLKDLSSQEE
jgi:cell shape-determining protein MreC